MALNEREPGGGRQGEGGASGGSEKSTPENSSFRGEPHAIEPKDRTGEQRVRDALRSIGHETALSEAQISDLAKKIESVAVEFNARPDVKASKPVENFLRTLSADQMADDIALLRDANLNMLVEGAVAASLGLDTRGLDKFHHALAHCMARLDGATPVTELAGIAREIGTIAVKPFGKSGLGLDDFRDAMDDISANNIDLGDRILGKARSADRCRELVAPLSPGWRAGPSLPDHLRSSRQTK